MSTKMIFVALFAIFAACSAGIVPVAPAAYVAPYASSYNAHVVNHAIAAPVAAQVVAAHAAPIVDAYTAAHSAPLIAAPGYAAYPYSAYPYAAPFVLRK